MPTGSQDVPSPLAGLVAAGLRARRAALKWTQAQLAAASGISQAQVSRYLAGDRVPTVDELSAMLEAMGLELIPFLGRAHAELMGAADEGEVDHQAGGLVSP